ncbi:hypothetical protein PQ462_23040 [Flavobacterium sp. KACC 22758]|uniref:hypothetical protein n=1 Tax=Flavobacterium sp. KACC 22758 TaxID=3025667 RepID=UPI0023654EC5|nr:hypothetical protein [Flavobacterium sp. KACC 22758]WDF59575.1 hypothetical protein PQ462_23040 [Flavobacterium sp. KACC 22758]
MRKITFLFAFTALLLTKVSGQVSSSLSIIDTRYNNDLPNFSAYNIRADFKLRTTIGVPGDGSYSTNLTISPWENVGNSGDKNHQLSFNNGGVFYRNANPLDAQWGGWKQILMTDENGNIGIGSTYSTSSLTIRKTAGEKDSHIYFGDGLAVSGQPSSRLCFGGFGIQNAGFVWVPNNSLDQGKLLLSFGGSDNGANNPVKMTFQSDGNVGIGITNPKNELDVNGTIHSKEVKVDMNGWSDFVFKKEYNLPTLTEVEKHITEKGHLENIPSEEEVLKKGINLGDMNAKLLQKIEELTLYLLKQDKSIEDLKIEVNNLKKQYK